MKTSIKTDYAIHSLMLLAKNNNEMSVNELAKNQDISKSYLAKVMQKLSNADIVQSTEGKSGGYKLTRPPEKINLSEVVKIMEGKINVFECLDDKRNCEIKERCKIHFAFKNSYQQMLKELEKTSIKDILEPELKKER